MFYDKLFSSLDFTLPRAATGRRGFPKEAMVCAFIVMKCEGFSQITDLADHLDNNRLIAHYCGFNIMLPMGLMNTFVIIKPTPETTAMTVPAMVRKPPIARTTSMMTRTSSWFSSTHAPTFVSTCSPVDMRSLIVGSKLRENRL